MRNEMANTVVVVYVVLNAITAAVFFIAALAVTFLTPFAMTMVMDNQPIALPAEMSAMALQQLATGLGVIIGVLLFLTSAFFLAIAVGLWKRSAWARYAQLVVAVPQLFSIPIGTLVGGFAIYAFGFDKEVKAQFNGTHPQEISKRVTVVTSRKKKK